MKCENHRPIVKKIRNLCANHRLLAKKFFICAKITCDLYKVELVLNKYKAYVKNHWPLAKKIQKFQVNDEKYRHNRPTQMKNTLNQSHNDTIRR